MPSETTAAAENAFEVRSLPWDSRHFGFPVALAGNRRPSEEDLRAAVSAADASGVRCLYFLCDSDAPVGLAYAATLGFDLVDLRVTLTLGIPVEGGGNGRATGRDFRVRRATPADVDALRAMARSSFSSSRFYVDQRFPREAVDELFSIWVEREVTEPDGFGYVVEKEDGMAGFASGRLEGEGRARIGLVAVAEWARGAGVGRAAVRALVAGLAEGGAREVSVVTQGRNVGAIRLYEDAGFRTSSVQLWFHRWR